MTDTLAEPQIAPHNQTNSEAIANGSHHQARQSEQLLGELQKMQASYNRERMPSAKTRKAWLKSLKAMLKENQQAIIEAIDTDFNGRSADETKLAELMPSIQGINHSLHKVSGWMRPSYRWPGLTMMPAITKVHYQPLGVVGILVPWNYPLFLAIGPLTAALAAGNRAMIKMPEHTPTFSALFEKLIQQYLGDEVAKVCNGGAELASEFTKLPLDHIVFTGSTHIGHHVMRAAADNLTPVTLELGGKSPVIVNDTIDLALAAERICFGKSVNAGQTCVAPDYVLVPNNRINAFITAYKAAFDRMYPDATRGEDYSNMINQAQANRVNSWLDSAQQQGAQIHPLVSKQVVTKQVVTKHVEQNSQRIDPVLVTDCPQDTPLLQEEIFGPALPIIGYDSLEEAVAYVNDRPRPLALYFFGHERKQQQYVINETHSGGVCINETIMHVAADSLPFGGIGPSGMGHYHAKEGFLTLSKAKAILSKGRISTSNLIYPPYGKSMLNLVYRLFVR